MEKTGASMRICFTSDFHGSEAHYAHLTELLHAERPALVILGGDMFPDGREPDPADAQRAFMRTTFRDVLATWHRNDPALQVACITGNHDWLTTQDELRAFQDQGLLRWLEPQTPWNCNGYNLIGFPHTPPTPFWLKDFERLDLPADPPPTDSGRTWSIEEGRAVIVEGQAHFTQQASLSELLAGIPEIEPPWVFVCHAPPHDTGLDRLPDIDEPVGSRAVRGFIEQRQPLCSLHGHIHESPGITGRIHNHIGQTVCINPGQHPDRLHAVLLDLQDPAGTLVHTVYD